MKQKVKVVYGAFGMGNPKDCTGIVEDIIEPKEGGIFTKYVGCNYLYKGYPKRDIIDDLSIPKKNIKEFVGSPDQLLSGKQSIITLCDKFLNSSYTTLKKWKLPAKKYCVSVKEIYRAITLVGGKVRDWRMKERIFKGRDVGCTILERDYAYRGRFQHALPKLDKEALKKNPAEEVERIFMEIANKEMPLGAKGGMYKKWETFANASYAILKSNKEIEEIAVKILMEIDLEKIKMDEADWYYCLDRPDFIYGDISYEDRMKAKVIMDKRAGNNMPKVKFE